MLNKELLMMGGQNKNDGIWLITVGEWGDYIGKCTAGNSDVTGKMECLDKKNPDIIYGSDNEYFEHQNYFILRTKHIGMESEYMSFPECHKPDISGTLVYVHLKKDSGIITKEFFFDLSRSNTSEASPINKRLFSIEDVGKTYRAYIGPLDTPPNWL